MKRAFRLVVYRNRTMSNHQSSMDPCTGSLRMRGEKPSKQDFSLSVCLFLLEKVGMNLPWCESCGDSKGWMRRWSVCRKPGTGEASLRCESVGACWGNSTSKILCRTRHTREVSHLFQSHSVILVQTHIIVDSFKYRSIIHIDWIKRRPRDNFWDRDQIVGLFHKGKRIMNNWPKDHLFWNARDADKKRSYHLPFSFGDWISIFSLFGFVLESYDCDGATPFGPFFFCVFERWNSSTGATAGVASGGAGPEAWTDGPDGSDGVMLWALAWINRSIAQQVWPVDGRQVVSDGHRLLLCPPSSFLSLPIFSTIWLPLLSFRFGQKKRFFRPPQWGESTLAWWTNAGLDHITHRAARQTPARYPQNDAPPEKEKFQHLFLSVEKIRNKRKRW